MKENKSTFISFLGLFTSFGTLICCALPALLVSVGLGGALVGVVSNVPGLIWISENKNIVFILSFLLISGSLILQYRARNLPCPIDPLEREACTKGRVWSMRMTYFSALIWLVGFLFAYVPMLFLS